MNDDDQELVWEPAKSLDFSLGDAARLSAVWHRMADPHVFTPRIVTPAGWTRISLMLERGRLKPSRCPEQMSIVFHGAAMMETAQCQLSAGHVEPHMFVWAE